MDLRADPNLGCAGLVSVRLWGCLCPVHGEQIQNCFLSLPAVITHCSVFIHVASGKIIVMLLEDLVHTERDPFYHKNNKFHIA